ncbi:MAG TPA: cupin domain-containing protein [Puia sp.]|nr:cupin domain-containing protein [Puia sp.]
MQVEKINIAEKMGQIRDYYNPRIAGELNGQLVKFVKFKGEFVWHHHDAEDEMFLVVRGKFRMELRDQTVELWPGEFIIIPRGVDHRPVADEEVEVILFEPATTLNTGNLKNEMTRERLEKI